ncbi:MAG: hypothetical protein JWM59_761 [Verrucomicrobiales bacterium]|nr:hypothetical protein [Verrucomicrobiales bacterium]
MQSQPTIADEWRARFGQNMPVGHSLRHMLPERWLRIHSLPGSKRYPGSKGEFGALLERHNTVASEIMGEGSACLLFLFRYQYESGDAKALIRDRRNGLVLHCLPELSGPLPHDPEDTVSVFGTRIMWDHGRFDSLISDVAMEKKGSMVFMSLSTDQVYSPYDGGADLILQNPSKVELHKDQWRSWLSAHPAGL